MLRYHRQMSVELRKSRCSFLSYVCDWVCLEENVSVALRSRTEHTHTHTHTHFIRTVSIALLLWWQTQTMLLFVISLHAWYVFSRIKPKVFCLQLNVWHKRWAIKYSIQKILFVNYKQLVLFIKIIWSIYCFKNVLSVKFSVDVSDADLLFLVCCLSVIIKLNDQKFNSWMITWITNSKGIFRCSLLIYRHS